MNFSSFDLNLLRVLDALLRERSTTRAGERIGLSQPAVSSALNRLRHALDDPLFIRRGKTFMPTEFAQSLEEPLRQALDELETMLGRAPFDPARSNMVFRISGSDFFAFFLMPRLGRHLMRAAPGVRVQLVDLVPDNYVDSLDRYLVDLAILPRMAFPAWVENAHVFTAPFEVIARRDHPRLTRAGVAEGDVIPLDLFCDLGHVLMSPEGRLEANTDIALRRLGRTRRVVMTMPFFSGVLRAVADSDLIAVLPAQFCRLAREDRSLGLAPYQAPVDVQPMQLHMAWSKRTASNAAHIWMREQIASLLDDINIVT